MNKVLEIAIPQTKKHALEVVPDNTEEMLLWTRSSFLQKVVQELDGGNTLNS